LPAKFERQRPTSRAFYRLFVEFWNWYDTASGPVAAFWEQRVAMQGADQFSFHTQKAVDAVLMPLISSGRKEEYEWEPVVP